MSFPWKHKRRFNAYAEFLKSKFGERVQKVSVDAGFTCPNRDGASGNGGCTFCNNDAFSPSYCSPDKGIARQIEEGIEFHRKRYRRAKKYLVYFQAYSNTYDTVEKLKQKYGEALAHPDVAGLVIGTRPDCVEDDKIALFREISKERYLLVEYGIESCYDKTLLRINRGHTFEQSVMAIRKTAAAGIKTGAHLIFGLPGESRQEMLDQAAVLSKLPLNNLKFHQLQILKNTAMAAEYEKHPSRYRLFSLEEYIDFVIAFIERLNPAVCIERFTAEVPPRFLAGPSWGLLRNDQILRMIEARMEENGTWQGKYCPDF
ncbi:MAG: TIGR01212 family radical SAM protein [Bacteroidales bacterium]|nr:TIGR01212 family radical SAM protein [Bacteroidales bacterium]